MKLHQQNYVIIRMNASCKLPKYVTISFIIESVNNNGCIVVFQAEVTPFLAVEFLWSENLCKKEMHVVCFWLLNNIDNPHRVNLCITM